MADFNEVLIQSAVLGIAGESAVPGMERQHRVSVPTQGQSRGVWVRLQSVKCRKQKGIQFLLDIASGGFMIAEGQGRSAGVRLPSQVLRRLRPLPLESTCDSWQQPRYSPVKENG